MRESSASHPTLPIRCDSCHASLDMPVICETCHTVQPVDGVNYYELFDIEQSYDVDLADLQRRYLNLSRAVHPDRFAASSPEVSTHCLRTSAKLNEAKRVLSDPIQRAAYLLTLAGGKSGSEDKTVPQEVLGDTLMLREEIDEASAANDQATLKMLQQQIQTKYDIRLEKIIALARGILDDEESRTELRTQLNAISYYDKMLIQLQ